MMKAAEKMVPELRFKEYHEQWNRSNLSQWDIKVIDGDRGKNYPNGDDFTEIGFCLFLNAKNVTKSGFSFKEKMFITKGKDELLRKGKLKRNDIVLTTRGSVGHSAIYDDQIEFNNIRINSGMVILRNLNVKIDNRFTFIQFKTPSLNKQLKVIAFGSAQPQLTVKEINKFKLAFPSLPEQQKIADFLSTVDQKIQQLQRKKELLAQYKKGMMQKLFSQEIRFKDEHGNDFPEWEQKKLGEVTSYVDYRGKGPQKSEGGIFLVTAKNIKRGFIDYEISKEFIPEQNYSSVMSKGLPKIGDVLFTTEAPLGNAAQVNDTNIALAQRVIKFRGNGNLLNEYLIVYMLSPEFRNLIFRKAIGTTVLGISGKDLRKSIIKVPNRAEQQKIANFLSALDEKVTKVGQQIEQAQRFKKGLLQKMFV